MTIYRKTIRFAAICGDGIIFWFTILILAFMITAMISVVNNFHTTINSIEMKVAEIPLIMQEDRETQILYRDKAELQRKKINQQHTESKEHVERALAEVKSRYTLKKNEVASAVTKEQEDRKTNSFLGKIRDLIF